VTACSQQPDPEPVATSFAAAVTSADFIGAPLAPAHTADAVADDYARIADGMGDAAPTVTVSDIAETEDDDVRQITFDVSWDLPGREDQWTYPTSTTMRLIDDEWLVDWQSTVIHPDLTDDDRLALRRIQAERADIVTADGEPIVTKRPVYRIGIDKTHVDDDDTIATSAADLADLVGVDAERFSDHVAAAGERAFVNAITLREADAEDLLDDIAAIDGAVALPDEQQLAPTSQFARPILGTVGEATEEIVEESEGRIEAGDLAGLSGLQRAYDEVLAGTAGIRVELVPDDGDRTVLLEHDAVAGEPVALALDIDLQRSAEAVLADVEPASAIVALDTATGDVLAAASGPGGEGYSTATLGQYPPGSTFKVVTTLALLRAGLSPDSTVECPAELNVDGRNFGNYSDYPASGIGAISLTQAFANSCNTAFMNERGSVAQADLSAAAESLGLGHDFTTGVRTYGGAVPAEAESETEHAASMIGQGRVLASPLAMAAVAASVANGETVTPRLVVDEHEPAPNTLTADEADTLQEMMRAVVTTGTAGFLSNLGGEPIGAKTGTAEYGGGSPPDTHGWMIATQGNLAVAVFVEEAESGSQTAGPLLAEFLTSAS
jgi:cell division protein FtsI/penicillin-binding protein 2